MPALPAVLQRDHYLKDNPDGFFTVQQRVDLFTYVQS